MDEDPTLIYEEFRIRVKEFCDLLEHPQALDQQSFLLHVHRTLTSLYHTGLKLPDVEPETDTDTRNLQGLLTEEAWKGLRDHLGEAEYYWDVFDPYEKDAPVRGWLADDLTDIYRDLVRGLEMTDHGASISEAIWHWRFHLTIHWGDHAVDALRALHWFIFHRLGSRTS